MKTSILINLSQKWSFHSCYTISMCFTILFSSTAGDCHDSLGRKDVCVSGAINKFTQQLTDYTKNHTIKNRTHLSHQ